MAKLLRTYPFPSGLVNTDGPGVVLTPHPAAARSIGVPHRKLEDIAIRLLEQNGLRVASPLVSRRMLRSVIGRVTTERDHSAFADRIGPVLGTVLRTGIDTTALAEHGSGSVRVLANVAKAYQTELRQEGLVDGSECMIQASMLATERTRFTIYGYFRARPEEIGIISALADEGSEYYLPCGGIPLLDNNRRWRDVMISQGWSEDPEGCGPLVGLGRGLAKVFGGTESVGENIEGSIRAISLATIEDEVRFVLGKAKGLIADGASPHEIAIVCERPDDYAAALSAVSDEYGLPLVLRHRIPLLASRFGGMIRHLFEAVASDLDFEPTLRLLMHPYGPDAARSAWRSIRRTRPKGMDNWAEYWPGVRILETNDKRPLREWARLLRRWLDAFGTRVRTAETAAELAAYYGFIDAITEIAGLEGTAPMPFTAFHAFISDILSSTSIPSSLNAIGVDVLTPDTLSGGKYKNVFILGLAEGMHPPAIDDNVVVDFYDRKLLLANGVEFESVSDIAKWASSTFFFALLAANDELTLSYPRNVENKSKIASPFFDLLGLVPQTAGQNTISSIDEWRRVFVASPAEGPATSGVEEIRRKLNVELAREMSRPPDEYGGIVGRPLDAAARVWSVSQFTRFGQCPFKWFASHVLKLVIDEEAAGELHPTIRGSLYHRTLELAVLAEGDETDIRAKILNNLEQAFSTAESDPEVGLPALPNWELQRADHLEHLRRAVVSPEFIDEGARVIDVEVAFNGRWDGLQMIGYIDRVDETPEGLVAIDYKTSSKAPFGIKDPAGKLSVDIQLPIYTHVALRTLYPDKVLGAGAYYSLTKGNVIKRAGLEGMEALSGFPEMVKRALAEGRYPVEPDVDQKACRQCDFDPVCRKTSMSIDSNAV